MYPKGEPMTPAMVTPDYIRTATLAIRTPEGSVEVNRYKGVIPTVEKCVAEMGTATMCAAIKMQLVALNIAANAARPMSEAVIDTVAPVVLDYILSLEVSINLADFRIVFDRAMRGDFGKVYGGIGCQDICSWFKAYEAEKMEAIDRYEERRKQGDLAGYRTNHRGAEITRMRDAMHQYNLEKIKENIKTEQS